jgi:HEAT repeat protein
MEQHDEFPDDFPPERAQNVTSPDEDERRYAVIAISKHKLTQYEDILLNRFPVETNDNKRHIVRALGNLATGKTVPFLMNLVTQEQGLILGDIARALGQLKVQEAQPHLFCLTNSPIPWVADSARYALRRIEGNQEKSPHPA